MPLIRKGPGPTPPEPAQPDAATRLATGTIEERWAAARALAERPGAEGVLGAALAREQQPRVREAILTSLARLGTHGSVEAVLPLLRSDEADLRTGALDALRAMPQAMAARLGDLLADPDVDVRVLACDLARHIPPPEANRLLAQVLRTDPEVNVCAAALDVLAEVGTEEALAPLAACADRFPAEAFLRFSIKVTAERIQSATRG